MAKKTSARKKPAKPTKPEPFAPQLGWLPKGEMAKKIGISVQAFDHWDVKPVARHGRKVYYDVADVFALIGNKAAERERKRLEKYLPTDPGDDALSIEREREKAELRLTQERAEGQRLKNAELRRELAPVELLTWALGDLASQVTPLLTPIPGEIKRRIPKITNAELHVMREIIAGALNLVAEVRLDFDAYEPDGE